MSQLPSRRESKRMSDKKVKVNILFLDALQLIFIFFALQKVTIESFFLSFLMFLRDVLQWHFKWELWLKKLHGIFNICFYYFRFIFVELSASKKHKF